MMTKNGMKMMSNQPTPVMMITVGKTVHRMTVTMTTILSILTTILTLEIGVVALETSA